jgi:hypothetical protein
MMDDADNRDGIADDTIQNAVLAMNKASDVLTQLRVRWPCKRMALQKGERLIEAVHISRRGLLTEDGNAIIIDFVEVGNGLI